MNFFVLWVVSRATRMVYNRRFFYLFAGMGAAIMALLYTLHIALPALRAINVAVSSIIILSTGVFVTFRIKNIRSFVKIIAIAYLLAFTVGGLGMSLYFLTDVPYIYFLAADWQGFTRQISWQLVLAGTAASYVLIKLGLKIWEKHKRHQLCNVKIHIGEYNAEFQALVDTGHSLREPLSQTPVIIAEFEQIKCCLPDNIKTLFYENNENDYTQLMTQGEFNKRIRLIPFTSLGTKNGMLIGFKPDRVAVENAPPKSAIIGIYNDKLCQQGKYQGLLSPEMVA